MKAYSYTKQKEYMKTNKMSVLQLKYIIILFYINLNYNSTKGHDVNQLQN